jgi:hypothetical protein
MAEVDKSTPARRGPGRPRKTQEEPESAKAERPSDPDDPRIGQSCHPDFSGIGYDDGATYRCENGVIVERLNF